MNNYLTSLPFHSDKKQLSSCYCPGQAFDKPVFKMYTGTTSLPTFSLRLPPKGPTPDLTYGYECVRVFNCDGDLVKILPPSVAKIKLLKDTVSYYLESRGEEIQGLNLVCGECYRINVDDYWSEIFYASSALEGKLKLELSNNSQLGDVPYQSGFKQVLYIDGEVCGLQPEIFESRTTENNGKETINYQRQTIKKSVTMFDIPDYLIQLLASIPMHDTVIVSWMGQELASLKKRSSLTTSTKNDCCNYDAELSLSIRDIEIIGGNCQVDAAEALTPVVLPELPLGECTDNSTWTATNEVICLKVGETPNVQPPPIENPNLPPPRLGCAPYGMELSRNVQSVSCENAFISDGVLYKKKIESVYADGNCGTFPRTTYVEACGVSEEPGTGTPCGRGPTITDIISISTTGMSYRFDGDGVEDIRARIKDAAGTVLKTWVDHPGALNSNILTVVFDTLLPAGVYTFEIQGESCDSSVSSRSITVNTSDVDCPRFLGISGFSGNVSPVDGMLVFPNNSSFVDIPVAVAAAGMYVFLIEMAIPSGQTGNMYAIVNGLIRSTRSAAGAGAGFESYFWTQPFYMYLSAGSNTIRLATNGEFTYRVRNTKVECIGAEDCSDINRVAYEFNSATGNLSLYTDGTVQTYVTLLKLVSGSWSPVLIDTALTATSMTGFNYALIKSGITAGQYNIRFRTADKVGCQVNFAINASSTTTPVFLKGAATGLPPCSEGPEIRAITGVTLTQMNLQFHGVGVTQFRWKAIDAGVVVAEGLANPSSAFVTIVFGVTLIQGRPYILRIQGESCSSAVSEMAFDTPGSPGIDEYQNLRLVSGPSGGSTIISNMLSTGNIAPLPDNWDIQDINGFSGATYDMLGIAISKKIGGVWVNLYHTSGSSSNLKMISISSTTASNQRIFNQLMGQRTFYTGAGYDEPVSLDAAGEYDVEVVALLGGSPLSPSKRVKFTLSDAAEEFENPGVKKVVVAGYEYESIETDVMQFVVLSTGNVKLIGPTSKPSMDGSRTCYPYFFDEMHNIVPEAEVTALRSDSGYNLPEGRPHSWLIMWAATTTPGMNNEMYNYNWYYFSHGYMQQKAAAPDWICISKIAISETSGSLIREPRDLRRTSWIPSFQLLGLPLNLPASQDFGITQVIADGGGTTGFQRVADLNVRMQVAGYTELIGFSPDYKWNNAQGKKGDGSMGTPSELASIHYNGGNYLLAAEIWENYGQFGQSNGEWASEETFRLMNLMHDGGGNVPGHKMSGDYFQNNGGNTIAVNPTTEALMRMLMSSQENARKRSQVGEENRDNFVTSGYFSGGGPYTYRHRLESGYMSDPFVTKTGNWVYSTILNMERFGMAAPDRRSTLFSWAQYEGINAPAMVVGTPLRLRLPGGDIIRKIGLLPVGYETMKVKFFWVYLFGGSGALWHSMARLSAVVSNWELSSGPWSNFEPDLSNTKWQADGSSIVQYNPSNPAHPLQTTGDGSFPLCPNIGENGAFAAAWLYAQISTVNDYVSLGVEYAEYSYAINGGATQNGYSGTNTPRSGALGRKISKTGTANFGQDNIATILFGNKPILFGTSGVDGDAVIFQNPKAARNDVHVISAYSKTFTFVGPGLHIAKNE